MHALSRGLELHELSIEELRTLSESIDDDVLSSLSLERTLQTKSQPGGTSPDRVTEALSAARKSLTS